MNRDGPGTSDAHVADGPTPRPCIGRVRRESDGYVIVWQARDFDGTDLGAFEKKRNAVDALIANEQTRRR